MHDRSVCACIHVGVSIDICRGSKKRLNVVCVDTKRHMSCEGVGHARQTPWGGGWGAVCKIKRKRCRKFIYRPTGRSIDGFIDPFHPCASLYSSIALICLSIDLSLGPSIDLCICHLSVNLSTLTAASLHFSIFPSL